MIDFKTSEWDSRDVNTPPSGPPRSGFAPSVAVEAGRRIQEAQAAVKASLPVDVFKPSPSEQEEGVVVSFDYRDPAGWAAKGAVSRGPSGLLISRIEVLTAPVDSAPHGVTTRILQRIPVEKILSAVRAHAAYEEARKEGTRKILGEEPAAGVFTASDAASSPVPRRKNAVTDELLRRVAASYLRETAAGQQPGALRRMAAEFDRPEKTIQGWVAKARREGWLGPGARGRTGAEPGPRLAAYLAESFAATEELRSRAAALAPKFGIDLRGQVKRAVIATEDDWVKSIAHELGVEPIAVALAAEVLNSERTVFFDDPSPTEYDEMTAGDAAASRQQTHEFQLQQVSEVLRREGLLPD